MADTDSVVVTLTIGEIKALRSLLLGLAVDQEEVPPKMRERIAIVLHAALEEEPPFRIRTGFIN
jgi:hypothetical protein